MPQKSFILFDITRKGYESIKSFPHISLNPRNRFSWYAFLPTHPSVYVTHHSSQHLTPSMLHTLSPMTPSNTCAHDPTCASFPHALQLEFSHALLHFHLSQLIPIDPNSRTHVNSLHSHPLFSLPNSKTPIRSITLIHSKSVHPYTFLIIL
jgi:hypothetical protein